MGWILFCKKSVLRLGLSCSKEAGGANRGGVPARSVGWILFCEISVLHFWWSASVWVGIGCSEHLYPYYNTAGPMPHGLWVLSVAGRFDASSRVRARGASTVARDYGRVLAGLGRGTSPSPRVVFDRATFPLSPPVDSRRVSGYGLGGLFGYEDGDGSDREGARPDVDEAGVLD